MARSTARPQLSVTARIASIRLVVDRPCRPCRRRHSPPVRSRHRITGTQEPGTGAGPHLDRASSAGSEPTRSRRPYRSQHGLRPAHRRRHSLRRWPARRRATWSAAATHHLGMEPGRLARAGNVRRAVRTECTGARRKPLGWQFAAIRRYRGTARHMAMGRCQLAPIERPGPPAGRRISGRRLRHSQAAGASRHHVLRDESSQPPKPPSDVGVDGTGLEESVHPTRTRTLTRTVDHVRRREARSRAAHARLHRRSPGCRPSDSREQPLGVRRARLAARKGHTITPVRPSPRQIGL